jgi:hypothetical protein
MLVRVDRAGEKETRATGRGTIRLVASVCLGLLGMLHLGTGTVRGPCNGQKTGGERCSVKADAPLSSAEFSLRQ